MPISLDPEATIDLVLEIDKQKPADTRPSFTCRFLTDGQRRKVHRLIEQHDAEEDADSRDKLIADAFALGIVGWKHLPGDFSIDALSDVLTRSEKKELLLLMLRETTIQEADKKKLLLQSATPTAISADPAAAVATS